MSNDAIHIVTIIDAPMEKVWRAWAEEGEMDDLTHADVGFASAHDYEMGWKATFEKLARKLAIVLFALFFFCCNLPSHRERVLRQFDHSLDSLITSPMYYSRAFTMTGTYMIGDQGDTLFDDPVKIVDTFYSRLGDDSLLVDANCHIYWFANRTLVMDATVTPLGKNVVTKYIYFQGDIDNGSIDSLRNICRNSDTLVVGVLVAYDKEGRTIKKIFSRPDDSREVTVFQYDAQGRRTALWRREYNKKYNPDSLAGTPMKRVDFDAAKEVPKKKLDGCSYEYDSHRNWIKIDYGRKLGALYRKIIYTQ